MYRILVRTATSGRPLSLCQEGDIVARCVICVDVFQADIHGSSIDTEFFEARKEVVELVRREVEFGRLDILRGYSQI